MSYHDDLRSTSKKPPSHSSRQNAKDSSGASGVSSGTAKRAAPPEASPPASAATAERSHPGEAPWSLGEHREVPVERSVAS